MTTIRRTYKYKLKPNKTQVKTFNHWLGCSRLLYNTALQQRIYAYKDKGETISAYDQAREIKELRKHPDTDFFADVPRSILDDTLQRLDKSYQAFFRGVKKGQKVGFPKFQGKDYYKSICIADIRSYVKSKTFWGETYIKLPKVGKVRLFKNRNIQGTPKTVDIIKDFNGWYACISCEIDMPSVNILNPKSVGIDIGIADFLHLSDGTKYDNKQFFKTYQQKVNRLQRKLARQKKGSNSRSKTKYTLAKLLRKKANARDYYIHNVSTEIAEKYDIVYVEKLKVRNMSKSAKGDIDSPGKNVKAKTGLNRSLLDVGINKFFTILSYKLKAKGGELVEVNPKYTSQRCNSCGAIDKESRKGKKYKCTSCGFEIDADLNAAKNILDLGKGLWSINKKKVG